MKVGLLGALMLGGAGGIYRLTRPAHPAGRFVLDDPAAAILRAIIPVMLNGAIEPGPAAALQASQRVLGAIGGLPLATQKEIQDLFALLSFGATRRLLAGVPAAWPEASPAEVGNFLNSWRTHRIGMLQSAYAALHDLIIGSWYTNENTWSAIGYPGPIPELA